MTMLATIDIETIVRQVLADLTGVPSAPTSPSSVQPVAEKKQVPVSALPASSVPSSADTLNLTDKLVTIASLEGKLIGIKKIQVTKKTVVTPSVRDYLRKQNILLEQVAEIAGSVKTAQTADVTAPVWVAMHHLKKEPASLLEFLEKQGNLRRESFSCIIKTVQAAVDWQKRNPDTRMIVLSAFTAPALCLANRYIEIRAILGQNATQIARDTKAVGANLIMLDPAVGSAYQLQDFVRTFLQTPYHCAESVWEALALGGTS